MIPQVFHLGPLPVNSFGLAVALSLFACMICVARSFARLGIDPAYAEKYVMTAGISGLLGARLLHLLENFSAFLKDPVRMAFASAGFTFYGGFIVAALTLIVMARKDGIPALKLADAAGPAVALGYAIGRLGCQLSGDGDYGIATTSVLGMAYSSGVVPTAQGVRVYPTPLYESTLCMAIAAFVMSKEKAASLFWQRPGRKFGLSLFLLAIERFAVESIRINPRLAWGLSEAQLIATLMLVVGAYLLVAPRRRMSAHCL